MSQSLYQQLDALLSAHTTMRLTTEESSTPQTFAYAHDAALALYFLLEPASPLAQHLAGNPRCAVTIQADGRSAADIRIEGWAVAVSTPDDWEVAYEVYEAKFPEVGNLLATHRFYRLMPAAIHRLPTHASTTGEDRGG